MVQRYMTDEYSRPGNSHLSRRKQQKIMEQQSISTGYMGADIDRTESAGRTEISFFEIHKAEKIMALI